MRVTRTFCLYRHSYHVRVIQLRIVAILSASRRSSEVSLARVAFSVKYVLNTFMSCPPENGDPPYK